MTATPRISSPLRWLGSAILGLVLAAALAPVAAHAVTFAGPTSFAVGDRPFSVAVGDFNGDSRPDLAAANHDSEDVSILLGNGSGGFTGPTNFALGAGPYSLAVGDFNGDSRLDLTTANRISSNVSILLGDGSGGFTGPTIFAVGDEPWSIAVGDFNGDSRLDLTTGNVLSDDVSILLGDGSGGFTGPTNFAAGNAPRSVAVGDFNGDSRPDLAVANSISDDVSILLGNGSGGFTAPTSFAANDGPWSVAVGDFTSDSRADLAATIYNSDNVAILVGDGSGGFTAPANFAANDYPISVAVGDFNGDSRLDLATANAFSDDVSVLVGNGSGGFSGPTNFAVGNQPISVAVGDFNGDSRPDLASANEFGNVSILLNTTTIGYPRPVAASPARFPLVLAYSQCTSPNRVHGPPDFPGNGSDPDGSCNPPAQASGSLTVGSPDENFTGSLKVSALVGTPGGLDDSDLKITVNMTDVRCQAGVLTCGPSNAAGGDDYTGEVQARVDLRITDKYNDVSPGGGTDRATGGKTFEVTVPCGATATPDTIGSTCSSTTMADAVYGDPSAVKEGTRVVWELGRVDVYDGGADGDADTPTGNTLFATQGVFVP